MQQKLDIQRAPQTPLRAERSSSAAGPSLDASGHIRGVAATSGGLIRSTLTSGLAALAVLTVVYLPAEYGTDPTGFGSILGLTEMGQIKQQLYAEAEAEDAAAASVGAFDPEVTPRLDRIEGQLAAIAAVIGAPVEATAALPALEPEAAAPAPEAAAAAPEAAPAPEIAAAPDPAAEEAAPPLAVEPAPEVAAIQPQVEAAVAEAVATPDWRDEVSYTLAPGEGIEVKLVMQEGQTARFEWSANGSVVNYDTHGDGSGQKISYEQGRATPEQAGELTAAFTGNHGWFWRNRTEEPLTVTLRAAGEYGEMRAP